MRFDSEVTKLLDLLIEDRDHKVPLNSIKKDIRDIFQVIYDRGYDLGLEYGAQNN